MPVRAVDLILFSTVLDLVLRILQDFPPWSVNAYEFAEVSPYFVLFILENSLGS